jgi:hypothetical protein
MHLALALFAAQLFALPPLAQLDDAPRASDREALSAAAPAPERDEPGHVLVRVGGDSRVADDERLGLMVVVNGTAQIEGTVETLVIARGEATLEGARIGDMTVYQGRATLGPQTVIGGDLHLVESEVELAPDAVVVGEVTRDSPPWEVPGLTIFGTLFGLGTALVIILAGVVAAAIAPRGVRRAGETLTGEVGKTLLAALVVWLAIPLLAGIAMITVLGTPLGMTVVGIALPLLAIAGYLIAGIRVGDAFLYSTRRRYEVRPTAAAAVGIALLLVIGLVPLLGPIVNILAVLLGAGALALTLWRRARPSAARAQLPEATPA